MHLIVGLGNPGDKYRNNRHNIGFLAVDAIARRHGFPGFREKFQGLISEGTIDGEKVLILKPQTFMNSSGDSVQKVANFYKLGPADITVIYDELDLAPGKSRIKVGGGNGGHNGLRSIDPQIGTDYRRIRLGIGHPGHKDAVMPCVLGDFSKADAEWLNPAARRTGRQRRHDPQRRRQRADEQAGARRSGRRRRPARSARQPPTPPAPRRKATSAPPGPATPQAKLPETGPMADMLKKLFGNKE